mmetsp:Transcript_14200/g.31881  ORF Transcript_14200/g.31881 Transcript_14200/m.31881 type:complete len:340 (+) Transcript_14200:3102-4121(+)
MRIAVKGPGVQKHRQIGIESDTAESRDIVFVAVRETFPVHPLGGQDVRRRQFADDLRRKDHGTQSAFFHSLGEFFGCVRLGSVVQLVDKAFSPGIHQGNGIRVALVVDARVVVVVVVVVLPAGIAVVRLLSQGPGDPQNRKQHGGVLSHDQKGHQGGPVSQPPLRIRLAPACSALCSADRVVDESRQEGHHDHHHDPRRHVVGADQEQARVVAEGRQPEGRPKAPGQLGEKVAKAGDVQEPPGERQARVGGPEGRGGRHTTRRSVLCVSRSWFGRGGGNADRTKRKRATRAFVRRLVAAVVANVVVSRDFERTEDLREMSLGVAGGHRMCNTGEGRDST